MYQYIAHTSLFNESKMSHLENCTLLLINIATPPAPLMSKLLLLLIHVKFCMSKIYFASVSDNFVSFKHIIFGSSLSINN